MFSGQENEIVHHTNTGGLWSPEWKLSGSFCVGEFELRSVHFMHLPLNETKMCNINDEVRKTLSDHCRLPDAFKWMWQREKWNLER